MPKSTKKVIAIILVLLLSISLALALTACAPSLDKIAPTITLGASKNSVTKLLGLPDITEEVNDTVQMSWLSGSAKKIAKKITQLKSESAKLALSDKTDKVNEIEEKIANQRNKLDSLTYEFIKISFLSDAVKSILYDPAYTTGKTYFSDESLSVTILDDIFSSDTSAITVKYLAEYEGAFVKDTGVATIINSSPTSKTCSLFISEFGLTKSSFTVDLSNNTFTDSGFTYALTPSVKTAALTAVDPLSASGAISIPSTVTHNEIQYTITVINNNTFKNALDLTSVTLPSGLLHIGKSAFEGCTNLTNIIFPDSLTSIGERAFFNCSALSEITIGSATTHMGNWAFEGCTFAIIRCTALSKPIGWNSSWAGSTAVVWDSNFNVASPDGYIHLFIDKVEYGLKDSVATILNGQNSTTSLTVPEYIKYKSKIYSVTSVAKKAFFNHNLTSITLPDTVTSIGNDAFNGCKNLIDFSISKNITNIGSNAFANCPNTMFYCQAISKPLGWVDTWRSYNRIVWDCDNNSTTLDGYIHSFVDNVEYGIKDNLATLLNGKQSVSSFIIPSFVMYKSLPKYVTSIDDGAFANHISLKEIAIPSRITSIGQSAFQNCTSLSSISLPNSLLHLGETAFQNCTSLSSVSLPNSLLHIGEAAFRNCTSLSSVSLPTMLFSLGKAAFANCTSLSSINIPLTITKLNESSFLNCSALTSVSFASNLTTIGNAAFYGCNSLISIDLPNSVTTIGNNAFMDCSSLTTAKLSNNLTSIGEHAFNMSGLTSIDIPDSVKSIGNKAFYGCPLTSATIGIGLKTIGSYIFGNSSFLIIYCKAISRPVGWPMWDFPTVWDCENNDVSSDGYIHIFINMIEYGLKDNVATVLRGVITSSLHVTVLSSVTYKSKWYTVTSIADNAFNSHTNLTSITLPTSLHSIGNSAFYNCTSLTITTLPNSLRSIGNSAFYNCSSLTSIALPDSLQSIGNSAFYNCTSLTSITLPDSLQSIDNSAFYNCTRLTSITLPDSLRSIGNSAFYNCTSLTSIALPNSLQSLGASTFANCSSLTSITLPGSLQSIGNSAFANCSSLTSISLPDSLQSIDNSAFANCLSLVDIHYDGTMFQFKEIIRGVSWLNETPSSLKIRCLDGLLDKYGNRIY